MSTLRPPRHRMVCAVLAAVATVTCAPRTSQDDLAGPPVHPENGLAPVIVVSIDTLRADRLPAYGASDLETPAIDRLARDGVVYERAFSASPLTLPSHTTLFTGALPPEHGVRDNLGYRLETGSLDDTGVKTKDLETLAEGLRARGYRTGAAVSSFVLRAETGLNRGFDFYDDSIVPSPRSPLGELQRSALETLDAVAPWIREVAAQPFFLFVHFYEPHAPYTPSEPFLSRYADPYDGEIATADAAVGALWEVLDRLGAYDRSWIVLTSDHGEGLGDHGENQHGYLLHREVLQVPLIVKPPAQRAQRGIRVTHNVALADLAPALLDRLEDPASESEQEPLFDGVVADPIYAETYHPLFRFGWSPLLSIVHGDHHLIEGPTPELYDWSSDPAEETDLAPQRAALRGQLRAHLTRLHRPARRPHAEHHTTMAALQALGYVGTRPDPQSTERLANPKDQLPELVELREATLRLQEGRVNEAVASFRGLVSRNPDSQEAWQFLGLALAETNRPREALEALQRAYVLSDGTPLLAESMAQLALQLGQFEPAESYLGVAIAADPGRIHLRFHRAQALSELDRLDEALAEAREARRRAPDNPDAVYLLGKLLAQSGAPDRAEDRYREALRLAADHPAAANDLALLVARRGQLAEARKLLESVLRRNGRDAVARSNLRWLEQLEDARR